jgi:hypothetical protein
MQYLSKTKNESLKEKCSFITKPLKEIYSKLSSLSNGIVKALDDLNYKNLNDFISDSN